MKLQEIQYKYSLDNDGTLIDINTLTVNDRRDYDCIGCGGKLRPVLGNKRRKHFRHKVSQECSFETYLHRMGKLLFEREYKKCLENKKPFILEYIVPVFCDYCKYGPCEVDEEKCKYDLTKSFTTIEVEKKDENLTPDLLLKTKSGNKIYIEIAVTHKSTSVKINSDCKIIEFYIKSEDDLKIFFSKIISEQEEKIKFFNFKPKGIVKKLQKKCHKKNHYFIVYLSGKCILVSKNIYEPPVLEDDNKIYVNKIDFNDSFLFAEEIKKAYSKGVDVKNCFLCRYHASGAPGISSYEDKKRYPIFCKFHRVHTASNYAAECEIYKPDMQVTQQSNRITRATSYAQT